MNYVMNFNDLDLDKSYSYADYLLWKFKERVELVKGKIFKMSPAPALIHQRTARNIYDVISPFFRKKTCEIFFAPFDVRFPSKDKNDILTVVQPDLCVICDPAKLDEKGCLGAPDLIIEILSPGNSKKEMKFKYQLYEESGVAEYWVVRPTDREVTVFVLENGKYVAQTPITDEDMIESVRFPLLKVQAEMLFKGIPEE